MARCDWCGAVVCRVEGDARVDVQGYRGRRDKRRRVWVCGDCLMGLRAVASVRIERAVVRRFLRVRAGRALVAAVAVLRGFGLRTAS